MEDTGMITSALRNGWRALAVAGCLGLVVALACTTPGGPDGPGDPECTIDADCGEGNVCSAAGECVPDDVDTNGDPEPECVIDGDCDAGEVCSTAGVCVPDDDPGEDPGEDVECTTNSECGVAEACTPDGICVPTTGEVPCLLDSDCLAEEVCSDAGFCAAANDPDPPGPSTGGGGGGGGGSTFDCTSNGDCAENEICDNGLCAPAPGETNLAEELAGCWRLTFTAPGVGSSSAIYQIDSNGELERTWGVNDSGTRITEEVRFTVPNAAFFGGLYSLAEQVVALDASQTTMRITTGLFTHTYGSYQGRCVVYRTTNCTDLALIEATLSGDPPATIVSGTYVGSRTCETPGEENDDTLYDGTITGEKLAACPDITLPEVESQEEQVDLCP